MSYFFNSFLGGGTSASDTNDDKLRIAIIGQSNFAADVLELLIESGYNVVGVFTIPDKGIREDILATTAKEHDIPVFKISLWRRKGVALPEVLDQYKSVNATLNVLPFCSQFIPMEVINAPIGSVCYHPSILPRHRGASAISWTLIEGDENAGFSIFWADDGLDTGPLLLTKQCDVESDDTLDTIYKRFLYPEGVKAMKYAVDLIANGQAPKIPQIEYGASYDPPMFKEENQIINLAQPGKRIFDFIRGLDSIPGAIAYALTSNGEEEQVRLHGASLYHDIIPADAPKVYFKGLQHPAFVDEHGLLIPGTDGTYVNVKKVKRGTRMIAASKWFDPIAHKAALVLSDSEQEIVQNLKNIWQSILKTNIEAETDFFASGAGSMDVVRLIEEVKDSFEIHLENSSIFMSPTFSEFSTEVITAIRSGSAGGYSDVFFNGITLNENKRQIRVPTQLFINGHFTDGVSDSTKKIDIVNPATELVICQVPIASSQDVDHAVKAAQTAFKGSWSELSGRQRGQLMFKLADLMEQHKEELATIESVDSGAVYTLALKTHIGMSIDAWRYFAGCTDKIEGATIPVSAARPNNILTYTKKEPIGVCGIITPWNYPLMMLSWKMAACIAAGNTVVLKPAQVCPLTALKFAELTVLAGFPPGVINILPGTGSITGQAIADHPLVRKLGFTGSTPIGKTIMSSCAQSNIKKCSLELGGKSPLVIFADCDLDKAVKYGMSSVFFNKGENCISAGRLFVEDKIHDEFLRRVLKDVKSMKIGNPLDRSTAHGPQNHKAHFDKLHEYCEIGVREGAKLVYGGNRVPNLRGYFFQPTIFTDVQDYMYIAREESFGPIMIISKFNGSNIESVIRRANNTEYGLASGVFTKDINKALSFADKIEAGTVFVNVYNKTDVAAPFGGFKQSGFGKDLGQEALNEYLKTKCVTIEY